MWSSFGSWEKYILSIYVSMWNATKCSRQCIRSGLVDNTKIFTNSAAKLPVSCMSATKAAIVTLVNSSSWLLKNLSMFIDY